MKHAMVALTLTVFVAQGIAETHLQGIVSHGTVLEKSGNPYIIDQDYIVPAGKELVIRQGCILLFQAFTGLRIEGKLLVDGSPEHPVVFTSQNDADYNPASTQLANPFDWNGIIVAKTGAGTVMNNFVLRYSAYGLNAQNPNMIVRGGVFRQNGQLHFATDGKMQFVQDGVAFSYGTSAEAHSATAQGPPDGADSPASLSSASPAVSDGAAKQGSSSTSAKTRRRHVVVRIATGAVAVGALGTGLYFNSIVKARTAEVDDLYAQYVNAAGGMDQATYLSRSRALKDKAQSASIGRTVSYIAAGLSAAGFALTIVF